MKKRKIFWLLFCVIVFTFAFVSCEDDMKYYNVIFDSNGGNEIQSRAIEEGGTFSAPETPIKNGCRFLGWYLESTDTMWNFETDTVTTDIVLKAKWERISHTVTFDSDGGNAIAPITVYDGNLIKAPTNPTRENSRFLGWFLGDRKWNFSVDTVISNVSLKAKWEDVITYKVTFDSDGGSAVETQHVESGALASAPAKPIKQDFVFVEWKIKNTDTVWNFETDAVTSDVTLRAVWKTTCSVTFNSNGGAEIPAIEVGIGEKITEPPIPTKQNAIFNGWLISGTNTYWEFDEYTVTDSITLEASWTIILNPVPIG